MDRFKVGDRVTMASEGDGTVIWVHRPGTHNVRYGVRLDEPGDDGEEDTPFDVGDDELEPAN